MQQPLTCPAAYVQSEIIPDLNARIASGEKQMENIIEAQGEQIARLGQRQDQLDASLSSLANVLIASFSLQ